MFPPYPALPLSPMPRGLPRGGPSGFDVRYGELTRSTEFDGVNDRMEVTFGTPSWPATGYTLMGWARFDGVSGNRMIAGTTATYGGDGLHLYQNSALLRLTARASLDLTIVSTLVAARRYHIAVTVDAARNYACYLDGELRLSGTFTVAQLPTLVAGHFFGGAGLGFMDGLLADWAFYARPLSAGEVLSVVQRRSLLHLAPDQLQGRYPLDRLIESGPDLGRSPDTSGLGRHLSLFNMLANPIVPFPA